MDQLGVIGVSLDAMESSLNVEQGGGAPARDLGGLGSPAGDVGDLSRVVRIRFSITLVNSKLR